MKEKFLYNNKLYIYTTIKMSMIMFQNKRNNIKVYHKNGYRKYFQ